MIFIPLLLAGTLTAQILDDTRGLGARPAPPPPGYVQMQRIAQALSRAKHDFVDPLEEAPLIERCLAGMDKELGAGAPKLPALARGARPTGERIGEYWRELGARPLEGAALDKAEEACLHAMIDKLDRRTEFLDRERFRELLVGSQGVAGIGVELELVDGWTTVVLPLEGAPSSRVDLQPGDRILEVDGVSTSGKKLDEVVKLLRGKRGSTVVLSISREGGAPMRREVVREIIRIQTVKWRVLDGGVLYVRISSFHERTLETFRDALETGRAAAAASFAGVILDLRGNPGGLFQSCIGVSAAFLPESAAVVETKGRNEGSNRRYFARAADYERSSSYGPRPKGVPAEMREAPLVVLINHASAACSEIVAAALQDNKRAAVIGEKTYGLGTVQTIFPLGPQEALRLTTARFFRPNGEAIEEKGVAPDVAIAFPERFRGYGEAADAALPAARKALQK